MEEQKDGREVMILPAFHHSFLLFAMKVSVIIPVLNEEHAIGKVIADIPRTVRASDEQHEATVQEIIVVDNGCTDNTAAIAQQRGARIVAEPRRGYGYACLAGIAALATAAPDIVVFLDGDYSDYPADMPQLLSPILEGKASLVIGARSAGGARDALLPQARFGNWLACFLIRRFFGVRYTDLGPFRAIRYSELLRLNMQDKTFGWTVEMQLKAAKQGIPVCEVPVRYRKRIGTSKITGTFTGTLKAGYKILTTLFYHRFLA